MPNGITVPTAHKLASAVPILAMCLQESVCVLRDSLEKNANKVGAVCYIRLGASGLLDMRINF